MLIRALDSKGRLQLPLTAEQAGRLPTERDGAVITVFLPTSTGAPRTGFSAAAQPLDARGPLTLTAGLRREAGIVDGADVLAHLDRDAGTVTVVAAGHMDDPIAAAIAGSRRPATPTETGAAGATAGDLTEVPDSVAGDAGTSPAEPAPDGSSRRLRIVG